LNQPQETPGTAIDIQDLRKVYRIGGEKVVALDHLTLAVTRGEICGILGTSGSGKSTLLNMMAGLEKPTRGKIVIARHRVDQMSEKNLAAFRQKNLGFVFQSYNLLPALTALENVYLPLTFRGVSKKIREKWAMEILTAVGLKTHARHKPTQMSGGQQQRVGIARAFVARPAIVFADEPTGNLDTKTTREIMELIVNLVRAYRQTLVLVTHDPMVAAYADRVVHISDGNIERIVDQRSYHETEAAT
jgi:putative ABC transport system ATP-binding protein